MNDFQINKESNPKRCEICHQIDMFDEVKQICLRCINISYFIPENDFKQNSNFKDWSYLKLSSSSLPYINLLAFFAVFIGHIPFMLLAPIVAPSYYTNTTFFLIETFIVFYILRKKNLVAKKGIFLAITFSTIILVFLSQCTPFRILVTHCGGKH